MLTPSKSGTWSAGSIELDDGEEGEDSSHGNNFMEMLLK